jgi:hypothetical protein
MYTSFLAGYSAALDTIAGLRNNSKFQQFLMERRAAAAADAAAQAAAKQPAVGGAAKPAAGAQGAKQSAGLDMVSFLIMPVQRIPRYLLLLKELLRFTPAGHPELERLQLAFNKVQKIAQHVNEQQRHVENMSVLLSIQNTIESSSLKSFGNLMTPTRRLLKQGILHKISSGLISSGLNVRRVYLFNDLLLWCETSNAAPADGSGAASGAGGGGSGVVAAMPEKFSGFAELEGLQSLGELYQKGGKVGFKFVTVANSKSGKQKEHNWLCRNADEQKSWLTDIRAAQAALRETAEEARRRRSDSVRAHQQPAAAVDGAAAAASSSSPTSSGGQSSQTTAANGTGAPPAGGVQAAASPAEADADRRDRANSF